jgi:predicted transglutaminase-like cysteine proteinase
MHRELHQGAYEMPIRTSTLSTAIAALAGLLLFAAPVAASSIDLSNPAFAQVSGPTSIPVGHSQFCKVHGDECGLNAQVVEVTELNEARWTQLVSINNKVNSAVVPMTDQDYYQVAELWTYPSGFGDCEDIALAKRRELIAEGWDPSTLLMAVVRETNGNGHAVLMARTDRGDMVLDNQVGTVKLWADTPYQFLKRQSQANSGEWVGINDSRMTAVTTTASTK